MASHYCEKCNRTMDEKEFYRSNNLQKYPENGLMNQCKKCLTMHVDNWNPDTFLWILEDIDVPWVPEEWNKLMAKYAQDPSKLTGVTIMGRYLSKMRLKQHKDYRWKDTEFLQQLANSKIEQSMKQQGYEAADIAKAVERASSTIPEGGIAPPPPPPPQTNSAPAPYEYMNPNQPDYFDQMNGINQDDLEVDLTDEDKLYLRLKWGKTYRPEEWVQLEKMYNEMMDSYDIQTAGHIDTLKLICKTSLKANQLIDIGDVESFQKMSKVYDALMKSGKFTAAQTKGDNDNEVDAVGEIVALCEKDQFIPKYYVDGPQDKVDKVIMDMQKYTHDLVTEELSLGNLIESALRKLQDEKEAQKNEADSTVDFDEQLFNYDNGPTVSDQDFVDFSDFQDKQAAEDAKLDEGNE